MRLGFLRSKKQALVLCSIAFGISCVLLPAGFARARQAPPASSAPSAQESVRSPQTREEWLKGGEDWDSLDLGAHRLPAVEPFVAQKDSTAGFSREYVRVQWRRGDPIDLWVLRPPGIQKPPLVLYLYGYPSETDRFRDDGFGQRVTRDGVAAIGFVGALDGHRYHDRPMKEWVVSELQEALVKSVHDVRMILDYAAARGDFDMNRVGMFGEGSGGSVAILAAAVDSRIKAVDLLDPWADWPDWMAKSSLVPETERARYLKDDFLKRVARFDPVQWLPRLDPRPVRIQHVLDDTITPAECKKRLEAAARPSVRVVRFNDTRALFRAVSGGRLFDWIKDEIRAATASTQPAAARSDETKHSLEMQ